jgi:hypothetical protein
LNKVLSLERGVFASLLVAAALTMMPVSSTGPPSAIASLSFGVYRKRARVMNYGTFEGGFPAVWNDGDDYGFVLYHDRDGWRKISVVELDHGASPISKTEFDKSFPRLPPIPKGTHKY